MTQQEQNSSPEPASSPKHYKAIIAIGIDGTEEDVQKFTALWATDAERRAHKINDGILGGRLTLLPLPENEVQ